MTLLLNALSEESLGPRFWTVAEAADRWRRIRGKLLAIVDSIDEDSGDALEALCFIVDESFQGSLLESLNDYASALQEIAEVILSEAVDPMIQALVVAELQKIVLPS